MLSFMWMKHLKPILSGNAATRASNKGTRELLHQTHKLSDHAKHSSFQSNRREMSSMLVRHVNKGRSKENRMFIVCLQF